MTELLILEQSEGVATLTLNRPETLNSIVVELKEQLLAALTQLAADEAVRAVVLTGAGRGFCVGQDLKEHVAKLQESAPGSAQDDGAQDGGAQDDGAQDGGALSTVRQHFNPITLTLAHMPKPLIAAVNGPAAGAGAGLAFCCDFRIGGPSTSFSMAFAGIGLTADTGASYWLPRLVGHAKATELMMLGQKVPAEQALALGLLSSLVDSDEQVLGSAQELAAQLAAGPTRAFAAIRHSLLVGGAGTLAEALEVEAEEQEACGDTHDHHAAVEAFLAKQKPVFTGQ